MRTTTVIDLLLAVLSDPPVSAVLHHRVPAWLAALLPAVLRALRSVLRRRRLDSSDAGPPLRGPGNELASEQLDQVGVAGHVGHLAACQLSGSAAERRPAPASAHAPRDVGRPPLTTAGRHAAKLRKQTLAAERAQPIAGSAGAGHARSSRPGPTAAGDLVQARNLMPLTSRDLEQIRRIVREEIERARGRSTSPSAPRAQPQSDDDEADPARRAAAELGRWTVRAARGEPGAAQQLLRQQATFYGQYDRGWCRRARRKLGMTGDEPLELEDALRALPLMKRRKSPPSR